MQSFARLQLLKNPSFRWFIASCFFTSFGAGLSYLTLSWGILRVDDSVTAIAILMLCFWLPNVIFGPGLGVFIDKHSRKRLIIYANGLRGVLLLGFGYLFRYFITAHWLYVLMGSLGLCFSLYLPATIALIREVIPAEKLLYANSLINMAYELGFAVGTGAAGFLFAQFGMPTTLVLTGIVFILSTIAVWKVKLPHGNHENKTITDSVVKDFQKGLAYLYSHKQLSVIYGVQLLLVVAFMTTPVLLAPFAKNILHTTVAEFGGIEASLSLGIILGGVFSPWVAKRMGLYYGCLFFLFLVSYFLYMVCFQSQHWHCPIYLFLFRHRFGSVAVGGNASTTFNRY